MPASSGPSTDPPASGLGPPGLPLSAAEFTTITLADDDIAGTVYFESRAHFLREGKGPLVLSIRRYLNILARGRSVFSPGMTPRSPAETIRRSTRQ